MLLGRLRETNDIQLNKLRLRISNVVSLCVSVKNFNENFMDFCLRLVQFQIKKTTINVKMHPAKTFTLFRPMLVGGEQYTQLGFFLRSQFSMTGIFIVLGCEWYH